MKFGVLGTGDVAHSIASKLIELGHEVIMGARDVANDKAMRWAETHGEHAHHGTFANAAAFGEQIFNCVQGIHALEALDSAGTGNLMGKILIDQANPYIMVDGYLALDEHWSGTTSLGEEIQKRFPGTRVVKTLNCFHNYVMTHPDCIGEQPTLFVCSDDEEAKKTVINLLKTFGWTKPFDLGELANSRYTEMLGAVWMPVFLKLNHVNFGFKLITET